MTSVIEKHALLHEIDRKELIDKRLSDPKLKELMNGNHEKVPVTSRRHILKPKGRKRLDRHSDLKVERNRKKMKTGEGGNHPLGNRERKAELSDTDSPESLRPRNMELSPNFKNLNSYREKHVIPNASRGKKNYAMTNYLIDIGLAITFIATLVTGLLKFTLILNYVGINPRDLPSYELTLIHDYGGLVMGLLVLGHLLLHRKWMGTMTSKILKGLNLKRGAKRLAAGGVALLLLALILQEPAIQNIIFNDDNTIYIEGIDEFEYDSKQISTVRSDIFAEGHFSIFDILVQLDERGKIEMNYHFDDNMNTHVIDEINGREAWWYLAYYDGGWPESNVFRMDHYPFKDGMTISILRERASKIEQIHRVFREEVERLEENDGKIIIPRVIIRGKDDRHTFTDVEVTAHNLRNDTFNEGVITAIDVIMTLGDRGDITYELNWYSDIGLAEVRNYFVDEINNDKSVGRCGFVYEEGSHEFNGGENHIHIPSDYRVLNSPEYEEYFWICI